MHAGWLQEGGSSPIAVLERALPVCSHYDTTLCLLGACNLAVIVSQLDCINCIITVSMGKLSIRRVLSVKQSTVSTVSIVSTIKFLNDEQFSSRVDEWFEGRKKIG